MLLQAFTHYSVGIDLPAHGAYLALCLISEVLPGLLYPYTLPPTKLVSARAYQHLILSGCCPSHSKRVGLISHGGFHSCFIGFQLLASLHL